MVARLMDYLIKRGYFIRVTDHNNTWCRHIHIIVCAYGPDGRHKVRISLVDLRRATDRICADYGLSIIDAPYLRRDEEYAKWFSAIVESGEIVVHPKRVRTTEHETREDSPAGKQWARRAARKDETEQEKVKRLMDRHAKNDDWRLTLQQECRQLEDLKKLCRELRAPDVWVDYSDIYAPYVPHPAQGERTPRKPYIRAELRNIGQLIGASCDVAEEEMWTVVQRGQPAVIKRCATVIPEVTIGIAQTMADVAQLCTTITDPYAERGRIDAVREKLQQQMDGGVLLRGMMALDTALLRYEDGAERDRIAVKVRSSFEDIHWHLQNSTLQLTTTQSVSTLRTAYGALALAMEEWWRFVTAEMPRLGKHTAVGLDIMLIPQPCPDYTLPLEEQVGYSFNTAIEEFRERAQQARVKLDCDIVRKYGPDPVQERGHAQTVPPEVEPNPSEVKPGVSEDEQGAGPLRPSLAGLVANAQDRSGQAKSTYQGKQASKSIKHQKQ